MEQNKAMPCSPVSLYDVLFIGARMVRAEGAGAPFNNLPQKIICTK